ncbi:MAG: hypothetical protein IJ193_05845 [Bacilli bacterium]|nr:hypothetical protein [Bacilli bacterium]
MYSVICLIGSTKYESLFRELEEKFSIAGYLVFSPLVYNQSGINPECGEKVKEILDHEAELKINKSDIVFVVDQDGYIGSSTRKQLDHALLLNKPVFYYSKGDFEKLT